MYKKSLFLLVIFCFTTLLYAKGSSKGNLDRAIDTQADFLLDKIPQNSIIAIIGISSGSENLSRYVTEGFTSYIMNNNKSNIKIVERSAMPLLQKEINFQYSGAVDDNFMVSLGKMVGANTVIAGTIYSIGTKELRFNVRAIEIETSYIIASNGINFNSDDRVKILLNGGKVNETLNRDNIPIRKEDGSISKANAELKQNQKQTVKDTVDFFSMNFFDREPRWTIGYNYYPDFPLALDFANLRNGFGFYFGTGLNISGFAKSENNNFDYIGDYANIVIFYLGLTYPMYFDWLWIATGVEGYLRDIASGTWLDGSYKKEEGGGFAASFGAYICIKRIYITSKYRYLFNEKNPNNFMLGIGINLNQKEAMGF